MEIVLRTAPCRNAPVTFTLDRMYQCPDETEVAALLRTAMAALPAVHRVALQSALIPPRRIPVDDCAGEFVVAIAEFDEGVLYWSDVEEGWEVVHLTVAGTIPTRG